MANDKNTDINHTVVIHAVLKTEDKKNAEAKLSEAVGLARAIRLEVVDALLIGLAKKVPSTLIGSGKVKEIASIVSSKQVKLVIVNGKLTPIQQRNLEKAWHCKVIDRTALIIEIFADRARTNEGKMQVNLASLEYQKSRLVRSWTHLERQRGGFGFLGGPGETQIESDRRMIRDQIAKIKRDLDTVKNTRSLHRKSRQSVPYPVVALVGYTNAGKTTLFNHFTGSKLLAEDMLFATLDPTMRMVTLPSKRKIILSDTVGFISDLPTELVAAFRATLEEVIEADLLIHVRDISHDESNQQKEDVQKVIKSLGIEEKLDHCTIEVLNKLDLLTDEEQLLLAKPDNNKTIAISAVNGTNCHQLLSLIEEYISNEEEIIKYSVASNDGKLLSWVYDHSEVLNRVDNDETIHLTLKIAKKNLAALDKLQNNAPIA